MRMFPLCFGVLVACGDDATSGSDSGPPGSDAGGGDTGEADAGEARQVGFVSVVAADYTDGRTRVRSHTFYVNFYTPGETECRRDDALTSGAVTLE